MSNRKVENFDLPDGPILGRALAAEKSATKNEMEVSEISIRMMQALIGHYGASNPQANAKMAIDNALALVADMKKRNIPFGRKKKPRKLRMKQRRPGDCLGKYKKKLL